MKNKNISIIGCGWLGLPLAINLLKLDHKIKGSTTQQEKMSNLTDKGINAFLITLKQKKVEGNIEGFLNESETLIINIPPGLRKNPTKNHVAEIEGLILQVEKSSIKNVIYISSTSVFEDNTSFPVITNSTKPNGTSNAAKQLIKIEELLQQNRNFKTTILRFSGLIDDERHPAKMLSGRKNIKNGNAPVNLIHKQDCIAIISALLKKDIWKQTLNASYPKHPTKKNYYTNYCKKHNLELPDFDNTKPSKGKKIDSSTLAQLLDYSFTISV